MFNAYGPTEGSLTTTMHEIDAGATDDPPIGRPLDHVGVEVLLADGTHAPVETPGELVITGLGVALGYHGRDAETAAAFSSGARGMRRRRYRTGDVVTVDRDGVFRFVGRKGDQVKVAGYRIEPREVEALAESVGGVASAVAVGVGDASDTRSIALFLTVEQSESIVRLEEHERSLVADWRAIYDDNGTAASNMHDRTSFFGWRSSTDNAPIPRWEMRKWVEETIDLIGPSPEEEILEIGCGSGLLLHRLARFARRYVGTDFSATTLAGLQATLDRSCDHVELYCAEATDLSPVSGNFDVVVINSVTQHFPSERYLHAVLSDAVNRCRPGGRVVIGDVRSRPLLDAFYTEVIAERLGSVPSEADVRQAVNAEPQLVIAPQWFAQFAGVAASVSRVSVTPKRSRVRNELTRFRFDVVLEVGGSPPRRVDQWLEWRDVGSMPRLEALARGLPADRHAIGIIAIPNARLAGVASTGALEPADVIAVAARAGVHAELSVVTSGADGSFDAVFSVDAAPAAFPAHRSRWPGELINSPLRVVANQRREVAVVADVRRRLQGALPAAAVPSRIEVIASMPLTPSGKIDRALLARRADGKYVRAPDGAGGSVGLVANLVEMLKDALGRCDVDDHSDFFASGGSSLRAMRLVARIREVYGVELPPSAVFDSVTIAELARTVGRASLAGPPPRRRAGRHRALPLSASQQRLWIAQQLAGDNDVSLVIPALCWIRTTLASDRFVVACRAVIERHEVLRARVEFGPNGPEQRFDVGPSACEIATRRAREPRAAERLATQWAFRPFDLESGPLIRFLTVECPDEHGTLVAIAVHHIVGDAASLTIVQRELISACLNERALAEPDSRDLAVDFGDVVAWEAGRATSITDHCVAWQGLLAMPAPASLPFTCTGAATDAARAEVLILKVPEVVADGVERAAVELGTSRFCVLAGCHLFAIVSATGAASVAAAVPVSGRTAVELEGVVGPLLNLIVLGVEIDAGAGLVDVVRAAHCALVAALAHQQAPYDEICRAAPEGWPRGEYGVVEAMVQYLEQDGPSHVEGIEVVRVPDPGVVTRFPLEVLFEDDREGLRIRLTFSPGRVPAAAIRGYGSVLLSLLAELADPVDPGHSGRASIGANPNASHPV